jgi:predicted aminopeptidase
MIRIVARLIVVASGCWLLSSCYVLRQGFVQNDLINSRIAIAEAKLRPEYDVHAEKFELLKAVLAFASTEGLNTWQAYEYLVDIGQRPVSYLVKAAEPFAFKWKTWWFPVVGRVPYLGYYSPEDQRQHARKLKQQGFDVSSGQVTAFSSLGFFEDPIFSSMLMRSDEQFSALIFHELTHRTVWLRGSVQFNENVAEFVSEKLNEAFWTQRQRPELLEIMKLKRAGEQHLYTWVASLRKNLSEFYQQSADLDTEARVSKKAEIIQSALQNNFPDLETAQLRKARQIDWNNATIMGFGLYRSDIDQIEKAYRCRAFPTMGEFLATFASSVKKYESIEKLNPDWCHPEKRSA